MPADTSMLPTPNSQKARTMAVFIIRSQRLPVSIISDEKIRQTICTGIAAVLMCGDSVGEVAFCDALKSLKNMLAISPLFLHKLHIVLPSVLECIISPSSDKRQLSLQALNALALAHHSLLAGSAQSGTCESCVLNVRSFIDAQCAGDAVSTSPRITAILSSALSKSRAKPLDAEIPGDKQHLPASKWALHILHALLVLSTSRRHSLYLHPRSIRLFVTLIGQALNSGNIEIRSGGEHGWKGLVWAFGKLCSSAPTPLIQANKKGSKGDVERRAFEVVKQELGGGIGKTLVSTLLAQGLDSVEGLLRYKKEEADVVTMALEVVASMVSSESKATAKEGVELLVHLLSGVGSTDLFSALSVSQALSTPLPTNVDEFSSAGSVIDAFQCDDPRLLTEHEIGHNWDALAEIWKRAAKTSLEESSAENEITVRNIIADLVQVWQSLLLIQAQLTQGHGHLTTPTAFADRAISIVFDLLEHNQVAPPCTDAQSVKLTLVSKLWRVMTNVFAAAWVVPPAARILMKILSIKWTLANDGVLNAWGTLTSQLASVGWTLLLEQSTRLGGECAHGNGVNITVHSAAGINRQLWSILAGNWQETSFPPWEQAVEFLGVPFACWEMNAAELNYWDHVLDLAISASSDPHVVIEGVLHLLHSRRCASNISLINIIFRRVYVDVPSHIPSSILSTLSTFLASIYPPQSDNLSFCLCLMSAIKDFILSTPATLVIPLVDTLQTSLCVWIVDEDERVPEKEYNDVVSPSIHHSAWTITNLEQIANLYSEILIMLAKLPLSTILLQTLGHFLLSGFQGRVPPPAICPLAFEAFWKGTFHNRTEFLNNLPVDIRDCLRAFDIGFGGHLGAGLPPDPESQSTFGSSIPDSETSRLIGENALIGDDLMENTPRAKQQGPEHFGRALLSPSPIAFRQQAARVRRPQHANLGTSIPTGNMVGKSAEHPRTITPQRSKSSVDVIPTPPRPRRSQTSPYGGTLKRRNDNSGDISCSNSPIQTLMPYLEETTPLKRAKMSPFFASTSSASRLSRPKLAPIQDQPRAFGTAVPRRQLGFTSEPASRAMSPIPDMRSPSEPAPRGKTVFDGVYVPTLRQLAKSGPSAQASLAVPLPRERDKDAMDQSSLDFDSWEAGLSLEELRSLRAGNGSEFSDLPDTEMGNTSDEVSSPLKLSFSDAPAVSPSAHRAARRSQPQAISRPSPQVPPLRRARATTEKLEALREAYRDVAGELSQMQGEELLQVVRLGHSAAATASEKLGPHFTKHA
ncbi:hypothetical protein HWV62_3851 [Athelia sp. TMB]|nr:hypothetical protein HWV62_3851 [Athelia sp. TMB]